MDKRVSEISHNGKTIIYGDYSGLKLNELMQVIEDQEEMSLKSQEKDILHLINFTDCKMSTESKDRATAMVKKLEESGYSVKTACFGIGTMQRLLAGAVQRDMFFAKSEESAKDWLAED